MSKVDSVTTLEGSVTAYWVTTNWRRVATGCITVENGRIIRKGTAPIFQRWANSSFNSFVKRHAHAYKELSGTHRGK